MVFALGLVNLLRRLIHPLWPVLAHLSGAIRRRLAFEGKNATDPACRPFLPEERVRCAFEVSSSGELEQVRPLLEYILGRGERLELIFCSPSAEDSCQRLYAAHPRQVRLLRLPLLSLSPRLADWIRAERLLLCRYDFFPELLLYPGTLGLLSANPKKKYRLFYGLFEKILCPSEQERKALIGLGYPPQASAVCDFRHVAILDRIKNRGRVVPPDLAAWVEEFPRNKRLIVGSAWPGEMDMFAGDLQGMRVLIAPHRLDALSLGRLSGAIARVAPGLDIAHFGRPGWADSPGPLIVTIPGMLLELYGLFGHALVGGGHGRSVHSLLEPFWSGCQVYCGPAVSRSTEYRFILRHSPHSVVVVQQLNRLGEALVSPRRERLESLAKEVRRQTEAHYSWPLE